MLELEEKAKNDSQFKCEMMKYGEVLKVWYC